MDCRIKSGNDELNLPLPRPSPMQAPQGRLSSASLRR
jgi:hypothetical protein